VSLERCETESCEEKDNNEHTRFSENGLGVCSHWSEVRAASATCSGAGVFQTFPEGCAEASRKFSTQRLAAM